jgi:hypothetical protein
MVTFELFARPMIEALAGMSPRPLAFLHARLKSEIRVKIWTDAIPSSILSGQFENSQAELVPWHGIGRYRGEISIELPYRDSSRSRTHRRRRVDRGDAALSRAM